VLELFVTRLSATVRQLALSRASLVGCTRFLRNRKVTPDEVIEIAAAQAAEAVAGRHVLLIQDTSEINYQAKSGRKHDLGRAGNNTDIGLFVHPSLAVDAQDGSVLGLACASIWRRFKVKAKDYQSQPIETKESHRWISTPQKALPVMGAARLVTVVADREADIYQVLSRVPDLTPAAGRPKVHVLVRCDKDRALAEKDEGCLRAMIATWPEAGRLGFELTARPGRPARPVTLAVRFGAVTLRRPKKGADKRDPPHLTLNIVEVNEVDPPANVKEPVLWRLYTTHAVTSLDEAAVIVDLYRRRWTIEQLFRTVKSKGLDVENSLIADGEALENVAAMSLIAAVRVMQCVHARGEAGVHLPASRIFTPADLQVLQALIPTLEGKTIKQKNPHPPFSLAWAVWAIARLGGWTGYATERPPGPITMHHGLQRFEAIATGFALANL
jgi:hypothetical protein